MSANLLTWAACTVFLSHHITNLLQSDMGDLEGQKAGAPVFFQGARTCLDYLFQLCWEWHKINNRSYASCIKNVVAFIRIWSQNPNTLRRPQQFSTFNWDTTTEDVTLYQVPKKGETLTYKWDTWGGWLLAIWGLSTGCKPGSNCRPETEEHMRWEPTWSDSDAGQLRLLHEELQEWMSLALKDLHSPVNIIATI